MNKTKIEWTEMSWNPSIGCTKISEGCKNCYAEKLAIRLKNMKVVGYENGFNFTILPERLTQPLKIKKPTKFFVNSMSDLFHEDMPFSYLDKVFDVIRKTPQHIYQILTKREKNMYNYLHDKKIPKNVWLGVTIENRKTLNRMEYLKKINASIRFISMEPLLEDIGKVDLSGIHWVIVGGESGVNARGIKEEWILNIKNQCQKQNVAFFFKQWGTWGKDGVKRSKKKNGRLLQGKIYEEFPKIA